MFDKVPPQQEYNLRLNGNCPRLKDKVPSSREYKENKFRNNPSNGRSKDWNKIKRRSKNLPTKLGNNLLKRSRFKQRRTAKTKLASRRQKMAFFFFMSLQPVQSYYNDEAVEMNLVTETNYFGKDLQLKCSYQHKPDDRIDLVQWLKGDEKLPIYFGKSLFDKQKYILHFQKNEHFYNTTLTIRNVTTDDFNTYFCEFSFHSSSYVLDITAFVYIPMEKEITLTVDYNKEFPQITSSIDKVYPEPNCDMILENAGKNTLLRLNSTQMFKQLFRINMTAYPLALPSTCEYRIVLNCTVSEISFNSSIVTDVRNCESILEDDDIITVPLTIIIIIVIITVITPLSLFAARKAYIYHKRETTLDPRIQDVESETKEMLPL